MGFRIIKMPQLSEFFISKFIYMINGILDVLIFIAVVHLSSEIGGCEQARLLGKGADQI